MVDFSSYRTDREYEKFSADSKGDTSVRVNIGDVGDNILSQHRQHMALLFLILKELQILNTHQEIITGEQIKEDEIQR